MLWSLAAIPCLRAATPPSISCDFASIRPIIKHDPDKTFHDLAAMGFHEVEGYSRVDTLTYLPKLKQAGLAVRACHTETPLVTADWESYPDFKKVDLSEAIDSVKAMGADYFIMGQISIGARGDGDDFYRRTADRMNEVAKACHKSGLKFVWQLQGFEFQGKPGLRPIDIFHERLDGSVQIEVDVFRLSLMGFDPAQFFKQWKGQIAIAKLMDKTKGAPRQFDDAVEQGAYQNLGAGVIDFAAVIKAANVKTYSVGQAVPEDNATDPLAGLRGNLQYLGKLLK